MNEKIEIEARANGLKFKEEYLAAREKVRKEGWGAISMYERMILEKGDDYLLG